MSPEHTTRLTPLPGHAVRDAVLDAAKRRRSARPYVVPGVLVTGLMTPMVAFGAADDVVPIPGTGTTTVTDTTATTTTATETTTETTSTETTATSPTTTTPAPTDTTDDGAPEDATPDDELEATDQVVPPAPPAEPAPGAPAYAPGTMHQLPYGLSQAELDAVNASRNQKSGRGNAIGLTAEQLADADRAERKITTKQAQSALGAGPQMSSGDLADLMQMPGASAVPRKAIESFQIPPFLLPIYQAAGAQYGIRWEVLAAINEIETNYGRNLNVSSAGAQGWMQFMPSTWEGYGTDANRDDRKDPYNPVDAIFAAGRYLKAADAQKDLRRAIFAYNHADWYVNDVLKRARRIAATPPSLVDALAQMADGQFPIAAKAKVKSAAGGVEIDAPAGSAVIAVQDGEIVKSGKNKRLGRFIQIRDNQGNVYTYGNLERVGLEREGKGWARRLPTNNEPVPEIVPTADEHEHGTGSQATAPKQTVDAWTQMPSGAVDLLTGATTLMPTAADAPVPAAAQAAPETTSQHESEGTATKKAKPGRKIVAGTVLGRVGGGDVRFEISPSGAGRVDPAPILSGWKLLQSTALFRVEGRASGDTGQVLLMSKDALEHRVLHDSRIDVYPGGRQDIAAGIIDRRVLATLAFLAESGLNPTVSSLRSGHGYLTSSGNVSAHSSGNAVDISAINGVPIMGNQGKGSITDTTVRKLLTLQGGMKPNQIITLMKYPGTDNTLAMGDHDDHIHVGFQPSGPVPGPDGDLKASTAVLKPDQWDALVDRIGSIPNPKVSDTPSKASLKVARDQLKESAARRADEMRDQAMQSYKIVQDGVKDPFIPPWLSDG